MKYNSVYSEDIKSDQTILFLWSTVTPNLEETVLSLKEKVGSTGFVQVENEAMLLKSGHSNSTFDVIISGVLSAFSHTDELLDELLRILKPNGLLLLKDGQKIEDVRKSIVLTGFTDINITSNSEIKCHKPKFETGKISKLPLSFAKISVKPEVKKVWTLTSDDMDDGEVGIIDSDALLDAEDLKRPDLSGIKTDCGTSKEGRRKACKGCTCGLADELDGKVAPGSQPKSACGSCYLGDAFRCASCPYLGMPPFKAGEKITLSDRQLNADA